MKGCSMGRPVLPPVIVRLPWGCRAWALWVKGWCPLSLLQCRVRLHELQALLGFRGLLQRELSGAGSCVLKSWVWQRSCCLWRAEKLLPVELALKARVLLLCRPPGGVAKASGLPLLRSVRFRPTLGTLPLAWVWLCQVYLGDSTHL